MADNAYVERLTPLDRGLEKLSTQIPWLSGRFLPTITSGAKSFLEIRSTARDEPTLLDKGAIPSDVWPVPGLLIPPLPDSGDPVFAASVFRFADAAIIRLWAQNLTNPQLDLVLPPQSISQRLSNAHSPALAEISSLLSDDLIAKHPEYSKVPPQWPTEFPPSTSKLFSIPIHWINFLKELLHKHVCCPITTNTILCALIWTTITRLRTRLTAVNGRQRISQTLSTPNNLYLGNAVLYGLSELPAADLATSDEDLIRALAQICNCVLASQSPSTINSRHIAEVHHLIKHMDDSGTPFPGWDLFGSKDWVVTSWADLDLYGNDFGEGLGKPRDTVGEILEMMIMLRKEDMEGLEVDTMWQTLTSNTR
ncbi:hypothetical protein BDV06DRAFT_217351 [Aspergillus oleicola]